MKQLILITHTDAQQDLTDQLRNLKQVSGFTFSRVEGHGIEAEIDPFLSAKDKVVGYTPRIRLDILLQETDVEPVLEALRNSSSYVEGHGIYWVTSVDRHGHL